MTLEEITRAEMTLEEARMLWLLTFGTGWVGVRQLFVGRDEVIVAYKTLLKTEMDFDALNNTIKIKCKS